MSTCSNTRIDELPPNVIEAIDIGIASRSAQFEDRVWQIMREEFGDLRLRDIVGSLEFLKHDIIKVSFGPD